MRIIQIVAVLGVLLAVTGFGCAPRGRVETPESRPGDDEALVPGDAPHVRSGEGASDRMNADKTSADESLAQGRYQTAVDLLSPWAAQKVADPQIYAMLGRALWKLGRYDDAIKKYEESLRLDYSSAYTHLELAELLLEIGKSGRALTEFELSVQFGKSDPLPEYNFGLALYNMGRVDEALAHWQKAYAYDPADPRYAEAMGIGLTAKDPAKALEYFEKAKERGADEPGFHNNFGLALERLGDYPRAETEFKTAVAGDPANTDYKLSLAVLYMESKRPELAVPLLRDLHTAEPDRRTYRIYLGRAYLETGRYDEAVSLLERWVESVGAAAGGETGAAEEQSGSAGAVPAGQSAPSPGQTADGPGLDEAYAVLAMSFRGLKQPGRAEASMRKALELRPENVAHLINYGVILAEDGKIAEAKAQWVKALRLDPENATARQNLSAYER